jgi:hypothetical protein
MTGALFIGYRLTAVNDEMFRLIKQNIINVYNTTRNNEKKRKIAETKTFQDVVDELKENNMLSCVFEKELEMTLLLNDGKLYIKFMRTYKLSNNEKTDISDNVIRLGKEMIIYLLNKHGMKFNDNDFGVWHIANSE